MDDRLEDTPSPVSQPMVCYRHPNRETRLRCSQCDKPICIECTHDAAVGQKCPECAKPKGRNRVVTARQAFAGPSFATSPVSFTIIGIAAVLYVAGFASRQVELELVERFALINILVDQGEWWRAITAAFLHASLWHIGFNMYALYLFGPRLEREVGSVPFAALYFAAAAAGSAASYLGRAGIVDANGSAIPTVSLGASGAIFGLFGAWIYVAYRMRTTPAGRAMFNQLATLLVINLALPLLIPRIDWRAHVGGLLAGIAIAWLWSQFAVGQRNARTIRTVIAGGLLLVLLVVIALA